MIHLNGGLADAATIMTELPDFAGVMLGRAAYKTPCCFLTLMSPFLAVLAKPALRQPWRWLITPMRWMKSRCIR